MRKLTLFDGAAEICISEFSDGNMRFFGESEEPEIIKNQAKLAKALNLRDDRLARLKTIYNNRENFTNYQEITADDIAKYGIQNREAEIPVSDGLVTKLPDAGIVLPLADCLGIVVYSPEQDLIGLLHSGRHNVEQDGPQKFIEYLTSKFGCDVSKLRIYFSPCAKNYRIFSLQNQKLPDAAYLQLISSGARAENIIQSDIDTALDKNFPSCSAGDKTTRFAIAVRLSA